jgi:hypothetical protein
MDMFVSLTLLATAFTVITPLVVRHGRLLESQRHYRVALDELSNQMERLTALPAGQLAGAMRDLAPSPFAAERLPGATLVGELVPAESGSRVVLKMRWNEPGRRDTPLILAGWAFPNSRAAANAAEGGLP